MSRHPARAPACAMFTTIAALLCAAGAQAQTAIIDFQSVTNVVTACSSAAPARRQ